MKPVLPFFMLLVFFNCRSFSQTWQWVYAEPKGKFSGVNNESDFAYDTETDTSGNVYVLGYFKDSLFLNNIYKATRNGRKIRQRAPPPPGCKFTWRKGAQNVDFPS